MGGTKILPPLQYILSRPFDPKYPRTIFLLTDGDVEDVDQILSYVKKNIGDSRIFTFGLGMDAGRKLVSGLAKAGRGKAEFIPSGTRPESKIAKQLSFAMQPVLRNVSVEWGDLKVVSTPKTVDFLFGGDRAIFYGLVEKYTENISYTVTLSAYVGDKKLNFPVHVEVANWSEGQVVHRLAVRSLVREVEKKKREADVEELTELAVRFGIASKLTSLVAVEERDEVMEATLIPVQVKSAQEQYRAEVSVKAQQVEESNMRGRVNKMERENLAQQRLEVPARPVPTKMAPGPGRGRTTSDKPSSIGTSLSGPSHNYAPPTPQMLDLGIVDFDGASPPPATSPQMFSFGAASPPPASSPQMFSFGAPASSRSSRIQEMADEDEQEEGVTYDSLLPEKQDDFGAFQSLNEMCLSEEKNRVSDDLLVESDSLAKKSRSFYASPQKKGGGFLSSIGNTISNAFSNLVDSKSQILPAEMKEERKEKSVSRRKSKKEESKKCKESFKEKAKLDNSCQDDTESMSVQTNSNYMISFDDPSLPSPPRGKNLSSSSVSAPLVQVNSTMREVDIIIQFQGFSGGWAPSSELLEHLTCKGKKLTATDFQESLPQALKHLPQQKATELWLTVFVSVFLETKFEAEKSEWNLIVQKATRHVKKLLKENELEESTLQDLIRHAKELF